MDTLGSKTLWSFVHGSSATVIKSATDVRSCAGHHVSSYLELATKVAELQFRNRDQVLLFRGQRSDYCNSQRRSSLKPSLFRPEAGRRTSPGESVLRTRFNRLLVAEQSLVRRYEATGGMIGKERVRRHRILRWAILQHYEVCPTPLLDVTHSLRIAASFANVGATSDAFVYVIAVPHLSGAITASAEAGLQIIRLSSVCPPTAVRPHIQEGYLLGEYPEMNAYEQKAHYKSYEVDFGLRLIAKFRFNPRTFWKDRDFPQVSLDALYPSDKVDPLAKLTVGVRRDIDRTD